jgi:uncharacterized protein YbjQ (UPF0145 family)
MALQSAFGNAAVARAATTGGFSTGLQAALPENSGAAATATLASTTSHLAPPASHALNASAPVASSSQSAAVAGPTAPPAPVTHATASGVVTHKPHQESPTSHPALKPPAKAHAGSRADESSKKQAPPSAHDRLAPLVTTLHHRAATARKHSADPGVPVASAQAAAIRPSTEQVRTSAIATVANLGKAKTAPIKRDDFKTKLKAAIEKATPDPKTEAAADDVMKTGASKARSEVKGELSTQNEAAAGQLKSAANPDVPTSEPQEVGLTPEPMGTAPAPVAASPAVPPPLPAEQLDYSSDRAPTDKAMADAGVTHEQLAQGNEPEFQQNLSARSNAEKREAAAEPGYRKTEAGIRTHVEQSAEGEIAHGLANIHSTRTAKIGAVVAQQHVTKDKHAAEHQRITGEINKIKNSTRKDVEDILETMEKDAAAIFEAGLVDAEQAYHDTFEDEKGGAWNWLTNWGDDWKELIEHSLGKARQRYLDKVNEAVDKVAARVDAGLDAAKHRVTDGSTQVATFVKGLDDSVRGFGEAALKSVATDFEQMSGEIDQRRDALIDKLTQQYKGSYERMSAMQEKLREENKSLWEKIYDATVGLIKKILAFKDMLLNVFARAAEVVGTVIAHPIAFLGNLIDAGKLGFSNFVDHIGEHLKKGFMEWLFGAVAEIGITLPDNFDLPGILSIVLQVLGLTYANIRSRAVKILGEKIVKALETGAEIFKILITKGPAGLWEYIKEKLGDLKAMVIEKIKSFVMEKIIMAGVTWIIGLLNPASAFFKACKAIYDIVMFFVEHGKQILDLVNSIIDSISAIAKGAIGAAASFVEASLARTIPVIIGFMASLLGVSGISEKIKEIINDIREPINAAIDWVINKAVDLVKAVGSVVGIGEKKKDEDRPKDVQERWSLGTKAIRTALVGSKPGATDKAKVDAALSAIQIEYGFKELTVEHTGAEWKVHALMNPEETIVIRDEDADIEFIVVRVGSEAVQVKLEPAADPVQLKLKMSGLAKQKALVEGLEVSKEGALKFLRALGGDWHVGELLVSFARNEQRGMPPRKFLVTQLESQRTAMAAVEKPVAAETRSKLVYLGEEKAPLSEFALVYREDYPGQFRASKHPEAIGFTEYNYVEGGARATAKILPVCIIRVDVEGYVAEIHEVSPRIEGGRDEAARIMRDAGFRLRLR